MRVRKGFGTTSQGSAGAGVVGALMVVYVVWGSTYLGIRYVVESLPPFLSAGVRFVVAGALLYPFAIRRGTPEERAVDRPTAVHWRSALLIGAMLLCLGNGGVSYAERSVPSGLAALLVGMVPLWMALFGRIVYRERLTPWAVAGLCVGFGGVALLAIGGGGQLRPSGLVVIVGATIMWSAGSLYARAAPMPRRPLVGTAMEMLAGGAACIVLGAALGEFGQVRLRGVHASSWIGLAYLIVFGSLIAYSAYTWLLRNAPTPLVTTYAYVNPAVAVFVGWLIGGEQLHGRTIVAATVIVAGVALIVSGPRLAQRARLRRGPAQPTELVTASVRDDDR